jgi:hypothetical protein
MFRTGAVVSGLRLKGKMMGSIGSVGGNARIDAEAVVDQFQHMVRRDGGVLSLLGVEDGVMRVGYRLGADPTCENGACVMPHLELQELMNETLARRETAMQVVVQLVS